MSYDAIHGPENVLMAPMASAQNKQENSTNAMLLEKTLADSMFYSKRRQLETMTDSASRMTDSSVSGKDTARGLIMSQDKIKTKEGKRKEPGA